MSSAGPQRPEGNAGNRSQRATRGLRSLPGFTTAAVVFVLIVMLGVSGVAIANWNQSATVAIAITAETSPTPSPTPTVPPTTVPPTTVPPTTVPPASPGNIVANPVIAARPALMDPNNVVCEPNGYSGKYRVSWPADASGNITYLVSMSASDKNYAPPQSQTVTTNSVEFRLANTDDAYGNYILRIQPMKGKAAGDPIYRTVQHSQRSQQCTSASSMRDSPLGPFSVTAASANYSETNNLLNVNWTPLTPGTKYLITITSTDTASSCGAEFTTEASSATLTFPPYILNQGRPTNDGTFNGSYLLRVLPMGAQAGDPIYKMVTYRAYDFRVGDFRYRY